MSTPSPLDDLHRDAAALFLAYGPPESAIQLAATFGEPELEYAAIRKTAGLMDLPQQGLLRVTGDDRLAFLGSMLAQEMVSAQPGEVRQSFWLNRQGRIQADLTLVVAPEAVWISVDAHQAASAAATLSEFLFSEDVAIEDLSDSHHLLSLHGPKAGLYLSRTLAGDEVERLFALQDLQAMRATVTGCGVRLFREDLAGAPGLHLIVERHEALSVYQALLAVGEVPTDVRDFGLRRLGWSAFNVARIEAGTPLMNIDFGETNLPHETNLLASRVSFTKGCYLGQEIVARMESQGRPKQKLMAVKVKGEKLPATGDHLLDPTREAEVIGAVTSSAPSPLLGSQAVCLAMLKTEFAAAGKEVRIVAEGAQVEATVEALGFVLGKGPRA